MKNLLTAEEIKQAKVTLKEYQDVAASTKAEDKIENEILKLDGEAHTAYENKDWNKMIEVYEKSLNVISEPKEMNGFYTSLHDQISGAYKELGDNKKMIEHLLIARDTRRGPYDRDIMFELGRHYLDEGDQKMALKHFIRAWDLSEGRAFIDEDSKYERFLKEHYEAEELY